MTGGIVAVLGRIGLNFGSGMTGGLAYVLRNEMDHVLNLEFVQAHELEEQEEINLRRLLESHLALTDSPIGSRLLVRRGSLPFVRVQPIHFQGTVQASWKGVPGTVLDPAPVGARGVLRVSESPAPHYA
jgi:glutamate synthase (NADPH) large chain